MNVEIQKVSITPTKLNKIAGKKNMSTSPPPLPTPSLAVSKCNAHTCPWWPYSDSKDFRTNAALILIILLTLFLCILAFLCAISYLMRRSRHNEQLPALKEEDEGEGQIQCVQVYFKGMKLAGMEAECAICLLEFVEGDEIKVLSRCKHGFHVQCIQQWLKSHPTCPTCRSNCLLHSSYSPSSSALDSITPISRPPDI